MTKMSRCLLLCLLALPIQLTGCGGPSAATQPATSTASAGPPAASTVPPTRPPAPAPTPTAEFAYLWENPFAGPAPEGSLLRLGRGATVGVTFSPDGSALVVWGYHGIYHYDPETLSLLQVNHPGEWVSDVAISPDARLLASVSLWSVYLWEMASGEPAVSLENPGESLYGVAFSPDGRLLASLGSKSIYLWDVATGELAATISYPDWVGVEVLAFSPDGSLLAIEMGRDVVLCEVPGGEIVARLAHADSIVGAALSPDGRLLASAVYGEERIHLWDLSSGEEVASFDDPAGLVREVAFSPDGHLLTSGSSMWELAGGELVATFERAEGGGAFSPDGRLLAIETSDGVAIWDVGSGESAGLLEGHAGTARTFVYDSVAFSPNGRLLASASRPGTVRLWEASSGTLVRSLTGHTGDVTCVSFSPDGSLLASGAKDESVRLWDVSTGEQVALLQRSAPIANMNFFPDGRLLAVGVEGGEVYLWDFVNSEVVRALHVNTIYHYEVAFSPDGSLLAAGVSEDLGELFFWVVPDLRLAAAWEQITLQYGMAFSPDGRLLALGSFTAQAGEVDLYEVASGELVDTIELGHRTDPQVLAFSPDGRFLAAGLSAYESADHFPVAIWDMSSRDLLVTLVGHNGSVNGLSFSPDGRLLASGSLDGTVVLWDATAWGE